MHLSSEQFWDSTQTDYLFRSIWPGVENLMQVFDTIHPLRSDARILDLCCGPGDVSIQIQQANPSTRVFGADFSTRSLTRTNFKLRHLDFLSQVKLWGHIIFLWYSAIINEATLTSMVSTLTEQPANAGIVARAVVRAFDLYLEDLRHFSLSSPYNRLTPALIKAHLVRPRVRNFSRQIMHALLVCGAGHAAKDFDWPSNNGQCQPILLSRTDAGCLSFCDECFDRVVASETALLLGEAGPGWIDDVIRVCKVGGHFSYAGMRTPYAHDRSLELRYVISELQKRRIVEIIKIGEVRLVSTWDPLFNACQLNDCVYTPYVVARKIDG